jgi:hypothetical protein
LLAILEEEIVFVSEIEDVLDELTEELLLSEDDIEILLLALLDELNVSEGVLLATADRDIEIDIVAL